MNPQAPNQPDIPPGDNVSDCAGPAQPQPPPVPDYELIRRIGGGAYGEVWLGRSTATGVLRAVKIVYRRTFDDERPYEREFEGLQRFERVSREHPGQLALFHVGRNDAAGCFYYVMELADPAPTVSNQCSVGQWSVTAEIHRPLEALNTDRLITEYSPRTLRADLAQGRLPAARVVELGLALTEALAHLHGHGLIHRDVKPSNIIFVGGRPKLADIGLVTDTGDSQSIVGTEGYLAPEGPGTPQADLYALGKVLYEAATALDRRRFPDLPPDLKSWSDARGVLELNEVLLKACARDAQQRYPSAAAMRDDLALLQRGQSVKHLRALERRVNVLTKTGLVTAVLLVAAAVAYLFAVTQARRTEREKQYVERLLYASDMNVAQLALEAGNLARAIALLEAHRLKPGREDLRGFEWYYLKNLCRGDEAYTLRGHQQGVLAVAVSPDGKLLASCGEDRTIRLWDINSKTNVATLRGHTDAVNALAFSPDGTKLATGGADKTLKLWDVARREVVADLTNQSATVTSVAFTPDGESLAVGVDGEKTALWDIRTGKPLHQFGPKSAETCVAVSSNGQWLAIAGITGAIGVSLWHLSTLQPGPELYEQAGRVWAMAFSPNSQVLAATRSDGVFLWDVGRGQLMGKLQGHEGEVHSVAFSPDGKTVATGSGDNTVRLWDFPSCQLRRILKGHRDRVWSIAFSPDGQTLFSGSWDHHVNLWQLSQEQLADVLQGHTDSVNAVAFAPDDRTLASASFDGTLKLWDVSSATNLATLNGHTGAVTGVVFSHDGTTLISCSLDKTIRFWNPPNRATLAALAAGKRFACLALSPDGRTLASGSGWWDEVASSNEVRFWDVASRQELMNPVAVHAMVRTLNFSSDGKTLAAGMADDSLELVDVASHRSVFSSTNIHAEVAWLPRGDTLAVCDETDWIGLFDTATGQISRRLQMPSADSRYAVCSPDGNTLAIFYTTTRIKLCNIATGREVATLRGHDGFGMYLAFSHDGQTLASASNDRTVRLWRAPRK